MPACCRPTAKRKKSGPKAAKTVRQPTRHSSRLTGEPEDGDDLSAEAKELGTFIIEGVCPRCGKVR